jgi:flagellar assembly protein FliH
MLKVYKLAHTIVTEGEPVTIEVNDYPEYIPDDGYEDDYSDETDINAENITEEEAAETAEQIISEARGLAHTIIEEAKKEAETDKLFVFDEARQQGFDQGYAQGEREARAIVSEAEEIRENAVVKREQLLADAEPQLVELIINISRKIIGDSFELNPGLVRVLIRCGLEGTSSAGDIKIRVSAEDYESVLEKHDEYNKYATGISDIEIIRDLSLQPADCVIETRYGDIDCSLGEQLASLEREIKYIYEHA